MDPKAASFTPPLKANAQSFIPTQSNEPLKADVPPFVPSQRAVGEVGGGAGTMLRAQANVFTPPPQIQPCRFFLQGACKKGLDCPFRHDSGALSNVERPSEKAIDQPTIEYDLDEGIHVCFGPGASIVRLDLGDNNSKESGGHAIVISGLPKHVTERDVEARLSQYGTLLNLSSNVAQKDTYHWYTFATFSSQLMAGDAADALNGTTVKSWTRLVASNSSEKTRSESGIISVALHGTKRRSDVSVSVKVQWFAPSSCAWVHYSQRWQAEKAATLLNGKTICSRTIEAKFQQPPSKARNFHGHALRQTTSFSVWLGGLPGTITEAKLFPALRQLTKIRYTSIDTKQASYNESECPSIIQKALSAFGQLSSFDVQQINKGSVSLKRRALVHFVNAKDAKKACDHFRQAQDIRELGGTKIYLQPIFCLKYSIPLTVFPHLRNQVDKACAALDDARPTVFENKSSWSVLISADTQKSIDKIKVTLTPIVEGEVVRDPKSGNRAMWSRRMLSPDYKRSMHGIISATGVKSTFWVDARRQEVRVFGTAVDRMKIKESLLQHHTATMLETHAVPILSTEFEYILKTGRSAVDKVIRASGAKSVSLNIKARSLLVTGDVREAKKARVYISKLASGTNEANDDESLCPVCFCDPDDPITLSCSDVYCRDCFHAWLGGSSVRDYPLTCLKDGCGEKVSLWDLQTHLPSSTFIVTLRFAIDDHVRRKPGVFQFCLSPTCPGIYELQDGVRISTCSTCMVEICTECNVSHGSSSCEDYHLASLPPNALRMKIVDDILTLRCPRCRQAFLDFSGCFALRCSMCPCGFCGWCLKDCESDAHSHVMNECQIKPKGHNYFGTFEQFESAQRANRKKKLIAFLSSKSVDERISCISSLESDLADLGIFINESDSA